VLGTCGILLLSKNKNYNCNKLWFFVIFAILFVSVFEEVDSTKSFGGGLINLFDFNSHQLKRFTQISSVNFKDDE
jgi:ABC-type phosphate/phosphonate transport system permease subunit